MSLGHCLPLHKEAVYEEAENLAAQAQPLYASHTLDVDELRRVLVDELSIGNDVSGYKQAMSAVRTLGRKAAIAIGTHDPGPFSRMMSGRLGVLSRQGRVTTLMQTAKLCRVVKGAVTKDW